MKVNDFFTILDEVEKNLRAKYKEQAKELGVFKKGEISTETVVGLSIFNTQEGAIDAILEIQNRLVDAKVAEAEG